MAATRAWSCDSRAGRWKSAAHALVPIKPTRIFLGMPHPHSPGMPPLGGPRPDRPEWSTSFASRALDVHSVLRRQTLPGLETADPAFLARIAVGPDLSYLAEPIV